jgi:3-oxoacyl-[acyl-carrier-protein] synthase-1
MRDVFIIADNIITSLGFTTTENAKSMFAGRTGIMLNENDRLAQSLFYASIVNSSLLSEKFSIFDNPDNFTRFEQIAICSIRDALIETDINFSDGRTLFILSTTKGNIDLLDNETKKKYEKERVYLWNTAQLIQHYFHFKNEPVVISNACISGLQAIITGARLISSGLFENIIINGTDILSEFVLSGFNSFKSLSTGPCRPFDITRDGLSLGEGSGTIVLSGKLPENNLNQAILVGEGFSTNDANHISGPSRTGEGLLRAIDKVLKITHASVDYISAHGTATLYNDEMESIAITRAGLQSVPLNSYKGYWGHTLGAAGVIESIMSTYSMKNNVLFNTLGYHQSGVANPVMVVDKLIEKEINNCLKIASGFGGCNAAVLFHKK